MIIRRYCTCSRGVGGKITNRTSVVHNYMLGVDICSHCGGIVPDGSEDDNVIRRHDQFKKQARACSRNGDHLSAIGFFKQAYGAAWNYNENCNMLSAIAEEYEKLGDYSSAEEYWVKCCEAAEEGGISDLYMYIARKGDFFYRTARYGEAIGEYEHALNLMNDMENGSFGLKYYAIVTHFLADSYAKTGKDGLKEKYLLEFKQAIDSFIRCGRNDNEVKANLMSKIAWEIYEDEWIVDEALILIDTAIELHSGFPALDYMRKAKILQGGFQYEEALKNYDIALAKGSLEKEILKARAECKAECIKSRLEIKVIMRNVTHEHLELVNRALKILPPDCDNAPYLKVKADILDQLGDPVKAKICRALSVKNYDEVDMIDKQLKKLKPSETYINITGIHYYQGFEPFKEGTVVDLIREPDNPHDRNAIRVEISGEPVGYVANSRYTLIKEVKSAADIKNSGSTQAEVQFVLFNEWVIAKLI